MDRGVGALLSCAMTLYTPGPWRIGFEDGTGWMDDDEGGWILGEDEEVVVAGGAESSSTAPRFKRRVLGTDDWDDWAPPSHVETPDAPINDMTITVGWNAAVEAKVTREEMDAWALRSHQRAIAARAAASRRPRSRRSSRPGPPGTSRWATSTETAMPT